MQYLCGNGREVKRFIYTASILEMQTRTSISPRRHTDSARLYTGRSPVEEWVYIRHCPSLVPLMSLVSSHPLPAFEWPQIHLVVRAIWLAINRQAFRFQDPV